MTGPWNSQRPSLLVLVASLSMAISSRKNPATFESNAALLAPTLDKHARISELCVRHAPPLLA
jgi:hypothetical protein